MGMSSPGLQNHRREFRTTCLTRRSLLHAGGRTTTREAAPSAAPPRLRRASASRTRAEHPDATSPEAEPVSTGRRGRGRARPCGAMRALTPWRPDRPPRAAAPPAHPGTATPSAKRPKAPTASSPRHPRAQACRRRLRVGPPGLRLNNAARWCGRSTTLKDCGRRRRRARRYRGRNGPGCGEHNSGGKHGKEVCSPHF